MNPRDARSLVVEVSPPTTRFSRGVLLYTAFAHAVFGFTAWSTHDIVMWPLWPILFFVAAVSCFGAAVDFKSINWVAWAAATTAVAFASRAGVVMLSWSTGDIDLGDGRVALSVCAWVTLTVFSLVIFTRGMAPLSRMHRRE